MCKGTIVIFIARVPKTNNELSDDQIKAFEKSGVGHDSKPQIHILTKEGSLSEPTTRLSIDLPESDHLRFKVACSATKRTMVAEVKELIRIHTVILEKQIRDKSK